MLQLSLYPPFLLSLTISLLLPTVCAQLLSPVISQVLPKAKIDQNNDNKETIDQKPQELVPAQWILRVNNTKIVSDGDGRLPVALDEKNKYCLIVTANFSITIVGLTSRAYNLTIPVPGTAVAEGNCEEADNDIDDGHEIVESLWLRWPSNSSSTASSNGSKNLLNITLTRSGRLAYLSSAVVHLIVGEKQLVLTTHLKPEDYIVPTWPLRYGLTCKKEMKFPLYYQNKKNKITIQDPVALVDPSPISPLTPAAELPEPVGLLRIEDLKLEAFRLDDEYPGSTDEFYSRYNWECEFHKRSDLAPILVGVGLAGLITFVLVAYVLRRRCGCAGEYQQV